jgi:hypothetical protein
MCNRNAGDDLRLNSSVGMNRNRMGDLVLLYESHLYDLSALKGAFRMRMRNSKARYLRCARLDCLRGNRFLLGLSSANAFRKAGGGQHQCERLRKTPVSDVSTK